MRKPVFLLALLAMLAVGGTARGATHTTTTVTQPPATVISLAPMKVKGYTLNVSAEKGSFGGLSVVLAVRRRTHTFSGRRASLSSCRRTSRRDRSRPI